MDSKMGQVTKVHIGYNYSDLNDYHLKINEMKDFATQAKLNVLESEFVEVSDISSSEWDMIAEFVFGNEQDAMLFTLKFKK
jgi:hypothetical protein